MHQRLAVDRDRRADFHKEWTPPAAVRHPSTQRGRPTFHRPVSVCRASAGGLVDHESSHCKYV